LRSIAEIYVPFRLYRVGIESGALQEEKYLALDAIRGNLDLFGFPSIPEPGDIIEVSTRNHLEPELDLVTSGAIVTERVRRLVYTRGFFRIRDLKLHATHVPPDFHIPYWIGFRGRGEKADLIVMDAVRGHLEGLKLRSLIAEWLADVDKR
jgi:hypothetical protein